MRAVTAAIRTEPLPSMPTLTNWTVPLSIIRPEITDQSGPKPCFCMRSPKPVPRTIKVTIIGKVARNAALTSFLLMCKYCSSFRRLVLPCP